MASAPLVAAEDGEHVVDLAAAVGLPYPVELLSDVGKVLLGGVDAGFQLVEGGGEVLSEGIVFLLVCQLLVHDLQIDEGLCELANLSAGGATGGLHVAESLGEILGIAVGKAHLEARLLAVVGIGKQFLPGSFNFRVKLARFEL